MCCRCVCVCADVTQVYTKCCWLKLRSLVAANACPTRRPDWRRKLPGDAEVAGHTISASQPPPARTTRDMLVRCSQHGQMRCLRDGHRRRDGTFICYSKNRCKVTRFVRPALDEPAEPQDVEQQQQPQPQRRQQPQKRQEPQRESARAAETLAEPSVELVDFARPKLMALIRSAEAATPDLETREQRKRVSAAACEAYRRGREAEAFFTSPGPRAGVVMPPRSSASAAALDLWPTTPLFNGAAAADAALEVMQNYFEEWPQPSCRPRGSIAHAWKRQTVDQ